MLVPSHRGQTWGEGTLLGVTSPPFIPTIMRGGTHPVSPPRPVPAGAAPPAPWGAPVPTAMHTKTTWPRPRLRYATGVTAPPMRPSSRVTRPRGQAHQAWPPTSVRVCLPTLLPLSSTGGDAVHHQSASTPRHPMARGLAWGAALWTFRLPRQAGSSGGGPLPVRTLHHPRHVTRPHHRVRRRWQHRARSQCPCHHSAPRRRSPRRPRPRL